MQRAVLTLLVGLMLSLGGGASALTFKSDGSVVQSDGKVLKQASPSDEGDDFVCKNATVVQLGKNILGLSLSGKHVWRRDLNAIAFVKEANKRRLRCSTNTLPKDSARTRVLFFDDETLCKAATFVNDAKEIMWVDYNNLAVYEAEQRGLTCGVNGIGPTQVASVVRNLPKELWKWTDEDICEKAKLPSTFGGWQPVNGAMGKYVAEAKRRGLSCGQNATTQTQLAANSFNAETLTNVCTAQQRKNDADGGNFACKYDDSQLCAMAIKSNGTLRQIYAGAAINRRLGCVLKKIDANHLCALLKKSPSYDGGPVTREIRRRGYDCDGNIKTSGEVQLVKSGAEQEVHTHLGRFADEFQKTYKADEQNEVVYAALNDFGAFFQTMRSHPQNCTSDKDFVDFALLGLKAAQLKHENPTVDEILHQSKRLMKAFSEKSTNCIDKLKHPTLRWRATLDIFIQEVTVDIADALGLNNATGALVSSVEEGSTASDAGIKPGDVIMRINGFRILNYRDLPAVMQYFVEPADTLVIDTIRNGKRLVVEARPKKLMPALKFENFRSATYSINNQSDKTVVAYTNYKKSNLVETKGVALISGELCTSYSSIDADFPNGSFEVKCPSGYSAEGTFQPKGNGLGSIGDGQDIYGNSVQYLIHADEGEFKISSVDFFDAAVKYHDKSAAYKSVNNENVLDTEPPKIKIVSALTNGPQGTVVGTVTDDTVVAELIIDGKPVSLDPTGEFTAKTYVPEGGVSVTVKAFDLAGLSSSISVRLDRTATQSTAVLDFDRLNPIAREAINNPNALALIIGLEQYEKTDAKAAYADTDASVFADYAALKLGIPKKRIKTLLNEGADISDVLLSVQDWLSRAVKQEKSDVYIFFAGHGLASDDGEKMYLLPYDGSPRLLSRTALLRDELFSDIAAANPRSVTVFLDTCYSGTTRGPDMLIASRPIAIRAKEQAVPDGFTVMTAAAGDQTAKPLEEAKHGMFSYFLMKGMEGDADANQDNQITAGELHAYVKQNVIQQSSGSQTPELQGDRDRVLVRFQ